MTSDKLILILSVLSLMSVAAYLILKTPEKDYESETLHEPNIHLKKHTLPGGEKWFVMENEKEIYSGTILECEAFLKLKNQYTIK